MAWKRYGSLPADLAGSNCGDRSDLVQDLITQLEKQGSLQDWQASGFNKSGDAWLEHELQVYRRSLVLRDASILTAVQQELSSLSDAQFLQLVRQVEHQVLGLGHLELYLQDSSITEIMVNGTSSLFIEKEGLLIQKPNPFRTHEELRGLVERIVAPLGRRLDELHPYVDARLAQGHRVHVIAPPLSLSGLVLTIRKFKDQVLSLDDFVAMQSCSPAVSQFLMWAVRAKKSIAVVGGTGSGKTTLLNALSLVIPASERIVTIEDCAELRFFEHPHVITLEARSKNTEGVGEVSIRDLVRNALRMRPDRIVVGECRGQEALDMLQAMNTGHEGSLTTLHANSCAEALSRLVVLVRYAAELPVDLIEMQIAQSLDLVIHLVRDRSGKRFVSHISTLSYKNRSAYFEDVYKRKSWQAPGEWRNVPVWVNDLDQLGLASSKEVEQWHSSLQLAL